MSTPAYTRTHTALHTATNAHSVQELQDVEVCHRRRLEELGIAILRVVNAVQEALRVHLHSVPWKHKATTTTLSACTAQYGSNMNTMELTGHVQAADRVVVVRGLV